MLKYIFSKFCDGRNSHQRCSINKTALIKRFTKIIRKHLCRNLFFNRVAKKRDTPVASSVPNRSRKASLLCKRGDQRRIQGCCNIQDGALCDNSYHRAPHLGCCSSPRPRSGDIGDIKTQELVITENFPLLFSQVKQKLLFLMMFCEYCNLRSKTSKLYSRIQAVFLRFLRKLYVSTKFLHQESM